MTPDTDVQDLNSGMKSSKAGEEFKEDWPGDLKFANERGHFYGCRAEIIKVEALNEAFAKQNPNHLIVEVIPAGWGKVAIVWTKTMSNEELAYLTSVQKEAERLVRERKASQEEANRKAQEAIAAEQAKRQKEAEAQLDELKRLAQVARKAMKRDDLVKFVFKQASLLDRLIKVARSTPPGENTSHELNLIAAEAEKLADDAPKEKDDAPPAK